MLVANPNVNAHSTIVAILSFPADLNALSIRTVQGIRAALVIDAKILVPMPADRMLSAVLQTTSQSVSVAMVTKEILSHLAHRSL